MRKVFYVRPVVHSHKQLSFNMNVACLLHSKIKRVRGLSNNVEHDFRLELYAIKCSEGLMLCTRACSRVSRGKKFRGYFSRAFSNNKVRKLRVVDESP